MDVCWLWSRRNLYVSIPVSANALQTQTFSQQTGNVFGRLENWADVHYRSYFLEKVSYLFTLLLRYVITPQDTAHIKIGRI